MRFGKRQFLNVLAEHEITGVAKTHGITLTSRVAKFLRWLVAGLIAFAVVLNSANA